MSTWQPIETAPRDGTWVLLADPDLCDEHGVLLPVPAEFRPEVTGWGSPDGEWMDLHGCRVITPTHWMPLPEPPEDA